LEEKKAERFTEKNKRDQEELQINEIEPNLAERNIEESNKEYQESAKEQGNEQTCEKKTATINQRKVKTLTRLNFFKKQSIQNEENASVDKELEMFASKTQSNSSGSNQQEKLIEQQQQIRELDQIENLNEKEQSDIQKAKLFKETSESVVKVKFEKNVEKNYEILTLN